MHTTETTQTVGGPLTIPLAFDGKSEFETLVEQSRVASPSGAKAWVTLTTHRMTEPVSAGDRPVIFAFNGGPGAASGFLDMGLLGPVRIDFPDPLTPPMHPPFALVSNMDSPLNVADVVLIDPPGTGFNGATDGDRTGEFFEIAADAQAMLAVIMAWCTRHGRENSPRFVLGESYGVIRAVAMLSAAVGGPTEGGALPGFGFNGAIFIGTSAHAGRMGLGDLAYTLNVSAMAATAYYHGVAGPNDGGIAAHVQRARSFEQHTMAGLLHLGSRVSPSQLSTAAAEMASLTGLPVELLIAKGLRVDPGSFAQTLLANQGLRVGIYDSRFTSDSCATRKDPVADDPAMGRYSPAFAHAARARFDALGISDSNNYRLIDFHGVNGPWNYGNGPGVVTPPDSIADLAVVMERDRQLRVFFASGYFDLATTLGAADYVAAHSVPEERATIKLYESGHMPYLGDRPRRALAQDLRSFVNDVPDIPNEKAHLSMGPGGIACL